MKSFIALTAAGITIVSLGFALTGCGSDTKSGNTSQTSSSAAASTSNVAGHAKTIRDYIKDAQLVETPIHRGDANAPVIDLPHPPGWSDAGSRTPSWAYAAIVDDSPPVPTDPASVVALVSKLSGDADPSTILDLAPGELQNLSGWQAAGEPTKQTLGGFDSIRYTGHYSKDGVSRYLSQETVAIPGRDGLYILQMNADALAGQEDLINGAMKIVGEQSRITP